MDETLTGIAAGVPFVALPPAGAGAAPMPMVAAWHPTAAPGSPVAMASALPLTGVPAWRVYFGLPGTGPRRAERPAGDWDLLLDGYAPMIEHAAAEFPAARAELRDRFPINDGSVAVVGGSAGGHVALAVLTAGQVPVSAAALINPAVRAESVVAVNEGFHQITYGWTQAGRAKAAALDMVARASGVTAGVLLITGEHEYPEFVPDQAALLSALGGRTGHAVINGMPHEFAEPPGLEPAPPNEHATIAGRLCTDWLNEVFIPG